MVSAYPADLVLAAMVSLGGLIGYIKKRSIISLVAGFAFGLAYAAAAFRLGEGDKLGGHGIGCITSALLTIVMAKRLFRTGKFMPAGLMAVVGALGLVMHADKAIAAFAQRAAA